MPATQDQMKALTPSSIDPKYNWDKIISLFPVLKGLENCPQDKLHHAEGCVGTHTRMVLDALLTCDDWQSLDEEGRFRLFWTAVFHDSGKPGTTVKEHDGSITSRGHSRLGAYITREQLRLAGVGIKTREDICSLILAHQKPFFLFASEEAHKTACRFAMTGKSSELLLHAKADAKGRICNDQADLLDRVELSRLVFEELDIVDTPYPFDTNESRVAYFERDDRDLQHVAYEDFRCEGTLVCGLPGSGKDTFIKTHLNDLPCVSLDDIRTLMGMKHEDNQGIIRQTAIEEAKSYLRAGKDFVWNAVNVSDLNRGKVTRLLREYNARIRIIYIEVDPKKLHTQNSSRNAAVPVQAIEKLAKKMSPPTPLEGHEIQWYFNGQKAFEIGSSTNNDYGLGR